MQTRSDESEKTLGFLSEKERLTLLPKCSSLRDEIEIQNLLWKIQPGVLLCGLKAIGKDEDYRKLKEKIQNDCYSSREHYTYYILGIIEPDLH